MLLEDGDVNCLCCLGERTCQLRFDRKARPYAVCLVCGSRIFLKTKQGLSGFAVLSPLIDAVRTQAKSDPVYAAKLAQQLSALVSALQGRSVVPAASAASLTVTATADEVAA